MAISLATKEYSIIKGPFRPCCCGPMNTTKLMTINIIVAYGNRSIGEAISSGMVGISDEHKNGRRIIAPLLHQVKQWRNLVCDTDSMAIVASEDGGLVACNGGQQRAADGTEAIKAL